MKEVENILRNDKRYHYYYLEKLFKKVSLVFSQLAKMVTDLNDVFGALESENIITWRKFVYNARSTRPFDRKKAVPFAMFIKDSMWWCKKENPEYNIVDCINLLKVYWDHPKYKEVREMYEYLAEDKIGLKKDNQH